MGDVKIREAKPEDHNGITALFQATYAQDGYPIARSVSEVESIIWYTTMTKQWVAVDGEQVVGHIAIRSAVGYPSSDVFSAIMAVPVEDITVVYRLAVHPSRRRQGIAKRIFETVLESEGRCAFDAIDMSKADEAFYRSMGLFPIDQVDRVRGDEHHLATLWVDGVRPGWQPRRAGDLPLNT